ncbi:ThiF family adenylyltransferase [Gymnodinialimonas sp. 2305UL16-5]|uniref:ThiF family adenylyltransferase n=1 Tax=Gymnodinialimonas mytili TaxID=3126503 RepID=UPI00309EA246
MTFTYAEFTTRNLGFVTQTEQARLRDACIFVCGTGGMGGAAIQSLIRAGVGQLILADLDAFEVSNLNRQVFCTLDRVDQDKAEATRDQCLRINPQAEIEVLDGRWSDEAERLVKRADVVINGTDDLGASLLLYRTAAAQRRAVIDAYAAPLPSVYVTRPSRPMPEERLGYPTIGTAWNALSDGQRAEAFLAEATHVMLHSTSRHYIDLDLAGEVAAGRRSRMSFAPMVISTGTLMAYEALGLILDRPSVTDEAGWFFNPYTAKVEKPWPAPIAALLKPLVARELKRMMGDA